MSEVARGDFAAGALAPYDLAIVDEAQDLSVAQLRFFAALDGDRPNALFSRMRRPGIEVVVPRSCRLFEENQFGRVPPPPDELRVDVFDEGSPAFGGTALRKQVTVYLSEDPAGPRMDLLIYMPAEASGPVLLRVRPTGRGVVPRRRLRRRHRLTTSTSIPTSRVGYLTVCGRCT